MSQWLDRLTVSLVGEAKRTPKLAIRGSSIRLNLGKEKAWGSDIAIGIGVAKRLKKWIVGSPQRHHQRLRSP